MFQLKGIDGSTVAVKTVDSAGQEKPTTTMGEQKQLPAPKKPKVKVDKKLTSLESITLDFSGIKVADLANMDTFQITYAAVPKRVKWAKILDTDKTTIIVSKEALVEGRYYTFTGLQSDTNYQFEVTARDANGMHAMNKKGKVTSMASVKGATAKFVAIKGKVVKNTATISSVTVNLMLPASYSIPGIKEMTAKSKPIYGFEQDPSVGFTIDVLGAAKGVPPHDPGGLNAKVIKNLAPVGAGWTWRIVKPSEPTTKGVAAVEIEITGLPKAGTKYMVVVNAYQGVTNESVAGKISIATTKYVAVSKVKLERNGTVGKKADDITQIYANWKQPSKIPPGASYEVDNYNIYLVYATGKGSGKVAHEVLVNADFTSATTATIDVAELQMLLKNNDLDLAKKQSFVLRTSTDGVESADAKFAITFSKIVKLKVKK